MQKGKVNTKLGAWLRAASKEQQEVLCEQSGTSLGHLRLMANAYRENPKLRLALAIVNSANSISQQHNSRGPIPGKPWLPSLDLMDLAAPTRRELTTVEKQFFNRVAFQNRRSPCNSHGED